MFFSSIYSRIPWLKNITCREKEGLGSFLIEGAAGSFVLRVVSTGLAFITSIILARLLGLHEYGTYIYVVAWVYLLAIPSVMGFDRLLIRKISTYQTEAKWGQIRGLIRLSGRTVLSASLALIIIAAFLGWKLIEPGNTSMLYAFWLALFLLPFFSLNKLWQSTLQGFRRVVAGQVPEMIIQPLLFLILVCATYFFLNKSLSAPHALLYLITAAGTAFFFLLFLLRKSIPDTAQTASPIYETGLWFRIAIPLLLIDGMYIINSRTDIIMLGAIKEAEQVGIYNAANRGSELITFVLNSVNMALAPIVSSLYATGELKKLQSIITSSARAVLILSLPILLALVLGGSYFLSLFGEEFSRGHTALMILCAGQFLNVAMGSSGLLLIMSGHERQAAIGVGISALLNIILNALLIPPFGLEGAAVATAASMITWNVLYVIWVHKKIGIHPTALGRMNQWKKE